MITQLVYTSRATFDLASESGRKDVQAILAEARRYNPTKGITGFLLIGQDWFAQVIEGESGTVNTLFRKLLEDPRHHQIRIIDTRLVRERRFGNWSMGFSGRLITELALDDITMPSEIGNPLNLPFDRIINMANRESARASEAR